MAIAVQDLFLLDECVISCRGRNFVDHAFDLRNGDVASSKTDEIIEDLIRLYLLNAASFKSGISISSLDSSEVKRLLSQQFTSELSVPVKIVAMLSSFEPIHFKQTLLIRYEIHDEDKILNEGVREMFEECFGKS